MSLIYAIHRSIKFGTLRGFLSENQPLFFKNEDSVVVIRENFCNTDAYIELNSCEVGKHFNKTKPLSEIHYYNKALVIDDVIVRDLELISEFEYNALKKEHAYFKKKQQDEAKNNKKNKEVEELKLNIEKLVNNSPTTPITLSSVYTKLLQNTYHRYPHENYNRTGNLNIELAAGVIVDSDFIVVNLPPDAPCILESMKYYVGDIIRFSTPTDKQYIIEINNILNSSKY